MITTIHNTIVQIVINVLLFKYIREVSALFFANDYSLIQTGPYLDLQHLTLY